MQIVSTIRAGHKIVTDCATFEVLCSRSMRGKYFYIVKDLQNGKTVSLDREDVLQAQREGSAKISA